jgi:triosephosphate isomerase
LKYIIANWKLNGSKSLISEFLNQFANHSFHNYVVLCPPHLLLSDLDNKHIDNFFMGSQNVSEYDNGAFTGEISAEMLAENKIFHSIVGHSERRTLFSETDEKINIKIKQLLSNNITPILCIGENREQRNTNTFKKIIDLQLEEAFKNIKIDDQTIIIAYEPIWSIGTGITPDISQIIEVHEFITTKIKQLYPKNVNQFKIAYGGSVNLKNYHTILSSKAVDGVLVGGASLDSRSFYEICNFKN